MQVYKRKVFEIEISILKHMQKMLFKQMCKNNKKASKQNKIIEVRIFILKHIHDKKRKMYL